MENFKEGDRVHDGDDLYGTIVAIQDDLAYVQFETWGGGGCVACKLEELHHVK